MQLPPREPHLAAWVVYTLKEADLLPSRLRKTECIGRQVAALVVEVGAAEIFLTLFPPPWIESSIRRTSVPASRTPGVDWEWPNSPDTP